MSLWETYNSKKRLYMALSGVPRTERIITAMVPIRTGVLVATGDVYDSLAPKWYAILEGDISDGPPWEIGSHMIDLAENNAEALAQFDKFDEIEREQSQKFTRKQLEEALRDLSVSHDLG